MTSWFRPWWIFPLFVIAFGGQGADGMSAAARARLAARLVRRSDSVACSEQEHNLRALQAQSLTILAPKPCM